MSERAPADISPFPSAREASGERGDGNAAAIAVLRRHTPARIGLSRHGSSLATADALAFDLAHARARDAVHAALDVPSLYAELETVGCKPIASVKSRADDRSAYLARPDWGRRLHGDSLAALEAIERPRQGSRALTIVVADGLSAVAAQSHAAPVLHELRLQAGASCATAPLVIATQARVALGDEIGEALGAELVLVLIGERPGLSSPDSLGAYLTWSPRIGRSDAERNCISNIRPLGLGYEEAARQLAALIDAMRAARTSGVALGFDPGRSLPAG